MELKETICVSIYRRMKAQDPQLSPVPEANDPYLDVSRFVFFVVCLKQHPRSFQWYKIKKKSFQIKFKPFSVLFWKASARYEQEKRS